jgi:hypothetical protein
VLKGTRWLLLKRPENLDESRNERQRLQECKASISSPERASFRTAELWRGGHALADARATTRRTGWLSVFSAAFERQLEGPRQRRVRC